MKKNFLFAGVFALLASVFAGLYLYDVEQTNRSMNEPVNVVVAASRIEQGKAITYSMLKEKLIPKQYVQPKYISQIKDFYSQENPAFMAIVPFEQGEQITATKILPITSDAGISNTIPDNKRAVTIIFDRDEVLGIISPGSRIDLISVIEYESKDRNFVQASCVIAQNLIVLAVGNNIIGGINDSKQENMTVNIPVTVAVSIQEAQQIMLAQEKGVIKIALRPVSDLSVENIRQIKIDDIFKDASKSVSKQSQADTEILKQIQKNQKEAVDIINKYSAK